MKYLIVFIILCIALFGLSYGICGFITWNFKLEVMTTANRAGIICLWLLFVGLGACIIGFKNADKEK
jgi:hypothetical protein